MLIDITPPITSRLAVWPGDTPPRREVLLDMKKGDNLTLSTLHGTVHLGAHADAPSHYGVEAPTMEQRPLETYVGPCQVMRLAVPRNCVIGREHLTSLIQAPRLLLATGTFPDPEHFNEDFAAVRSELVDWLHGEGVKLVGIDTPSVDPFAAKDLPAHRAFLRHDMAILEGLLLQDVTPGLYELIALPLRLVGFDASPVRAVLRK